MSNRILPLDGLRAIAALGVVWVHVWAFYGIPTLKLKGIDLYQVVSIVGNGVDFFFVISGFCMYLMAWKKDFDLSKYGMFLYRRFQRIAPAFYVSLLVYAILIEISNPTFPFLYNVFFHGLFLNNVVTGNVISAPFWSIGTEWHFYMILPLVVLLSRKLGLIKSIWMLSSLCILFSLLVYSEILSFDWWEKQILIRFPEFGAGIIAAFYFKKNDKLPTFLSGFFGVLFFIFFIFIGRMMKFTPVLVWSGNYSFIIQAFALPIMTASFAFLMYHVITQKSILSKFLSGTIITYLGRISYSVYLWHSLAIIILAKYLLRIENAYYNVVVGFILVSILTIILSALSYRLLESFYFKKRA